MIGFQYAITYKDFTGYKYSLFLTITIRFNRLNVVVKAKEAGLVTVIIPVTALQF